LTLASDHDVGVVEHHLRGHGCCALPYNHCTLKTPAIIQMIARKGIFGASARYNSMNETPSADHTAGERPDVRIA
jgi:hypothetical protein